MIELGFLAVLQAVVDGFDSHILHHNASIAQLVEQRTFNPKVVGSSPATRTKYSTLVG